MISTPAAPYQNWLDFGSPRLTTPDHKRPEAGRIAAWLLLKAFLSFIRAFAGVECKYLGSIPQAGKRTIYFANHTSHIDCMVLLSVLPRTVSDKTRPTAAADYWLANPIRAWIANNVLNCILVPRTKITRENYPIKQMVAALEQNHSLIIFPEGGRGDGSAVKEFKSGLFHIARACPDVQLVPVFIKNADRILPKGEVLPVPLSCCVTVGNPLRLEPNESRQQFLLRMKENLQQCSSS